MNEILSYAICFLIILLIALFNVKGTLSNRNISYYLKKTLYYISILITIVIMNLRINIILKKITNISTNYLNLTGIYNDISKIALFVVLFFVIQICVYKILKKIIVSIFKNINKETLIKAVNFGNQVSSIAVQRKGAQPSIPYLKEIEEIYGSHNNK